MTKHRALVYGATIPQDFLDAIQEFISTYISDTAVATVLNTNTVQIAAAIDNGQVSIGINGRWRFNTAAVNAVHPGGASGIYNLFATAADNSFTIGPPEIDSTVYTFAIQILPIGSSPGTALFRQIGTVQWNGTAITDVNLLLDDPATRGTLMPGDIIWSAASSRTGALLADGSAVSRTTFAALFNLIGTTYGAGNGSTTFNLPDFRGRTIIGVGLGTGLATTRAIATNGGEENHTLAAAESGIPAHTHPAATVAGTTAGGSTGTGSTGTGTTGAGTTGGATTGNDSPDHAHLSGGGNGFLDVTGVDGFVNITIGGGQFGYQLSTQGANTRHTHSVPGLSVPGLSVPALSIPALTVPSQGVTGTTSSIPAATATAAASSHNNMQPWATGYIFLKV